MPFWIWALDIQKGCALLCRLFAATFYAASVQVHLLYVHEPDAGRLSQDWQDLPPSETAQGGASTDQTHGEFGEQLAELLPICAV